MHKKKTSNIIFALLFVAIAIAAVLYQEKPKQPVPISPIFTPTPVPPTLTPTPTPVPLVGYCLKVPVIMYHHIQPMNEARPKNQGGLSVDPGVFDQQMAHLASSGYTTLFANELVSALKNKTALPTKSIVVTFDDGYRDNHTHALPIIRKYSIKANLMLTTGLLEGADYLTWDQVNDMKNSGLYYFVDHTWSHFNVGAGAEEKIRYEIETAKRQIQDRLGQQVDIFAYPYGVGGSVARKVLQENGFSGAFSTIPGFYQCDSFIFALHRTRIGNSSLSAYGL